jgi:hypothetical protein
MTARPSTRAARTRTRHTRDEHFVSRGGSQVLIRQIQRADAALLADGSARPSVHSRRGPPAPIKPKSLAAPGCKCDAGDMPGASTAV